MGNTHGRIGFVDVLPAGAGCTIRVNPAVTFIDIYFNLVINNRIDADRSETGMPSGIAVKRRDPYQAVDAAFPGEKGE